MSRRAQPLIEDAFDDDTDIPLPSRPLPNTGARGPLLQALDDDGRGADSDDASDDHGPPDSDSDGGDAPALGRPRPLNPGSASPSQIPPGFGAQQQQQQHAGPTVSDLTPYKKWTCIYPIYIDAKRAYAPGARRVARPKAVWWPLSKDIADATTRLGLGTLHEVQKCHPRDWDNPGRVRVQMRRDGRLVNERIKTKKQLLEAIAFYIQTVKPELIPKQQQQQQPSSTPASAPSTHPPAPAPAPAQTKQQPNSTSSSKPKPNTPAKTKEKGKPLKPSSTTTITTTTTTTTSTSTARKRLPQPPEPHPPLASRVSAYSPALPTGVLVDAVKAGMTAQAADNAAAPPGMTGKGKRKVLRVRG